VNLVICSVCGGCEFTELSILSEKLVSDWQLTPEEHDYIDRQQGTRCADCGANLRSIALADAIHAALDNDAHAVLEINEAGSLSPMLRLFSGHILATYPEIDMQALPYKDDSFDLVVHSDTLEHVADPIQALKECRRVLRQGAPLCFTVPTIVGRLSRSRSGLPDSYHGDDFLVHTEFGADVWTYVLRAGFSAVSINAVDYPTALAITARK
jgi:SAM-dependent methyltransferase